MALASLLHGGPRMDLGQYRVLELGCGNGANLLPMANYRVNGSFVGVDGALSQIAMAASRAADLGLTNVEFVQSDFTEADSRLSGQFEFIIAHGIFSWVPPRVRDALLDLCRKRLTENGLLYLNYNALPGWNIRGMVREFLQAQTAGITGFASRAVAAQIVAARVAEAMASNEHPYSQLMANEFTFASENHISYIGHEFLAENNHAYWRSDFDELTNGFGFHYVADADFNYQSSWIPDDLESSLSTEGIVGRSLDDTVDLLCYRQMHSPILTQGPFDSHPVESHEMADLEIASRLSPTDSTSVDGQMFEHPNGFTVEVEDSEFAHVLTQIQTAWPLGSRIGSLLPQVSTFEDDLTLLCRKGLIELRLAGATNSGGVNLLNTLETEWGGYITSQCHTRELPP